MVFCVVARVFSEVSRVLFGWLLGCSVRFLGCCQGGCSGVVEGLHNLGNLILFFGGFFLIKL